MSRWRRAPVTADIAVCAGALLLQVFAIDLHQGNTCLHA